MSQQHRGRCGTLGPYAQQWWSLRLEAVLGPQNVALTAEKGPSSAALTR